MHSHCWLLSRWNHHWKCAEKGSNAVHERMEVEFYGAQSQNHHLGVGQLTRILSFVCGREVGGWCKRRFRRMSSSSKDTVDKDPCVIKKIKCRNNIKKHQASILANHTQWFHQSSNGSVQTGTVQSSRGPVQEIFGLGSDRSQILTDWTGLGPDRSFMVSRVMVYFPGY